MENQSRMVGVMSGEVTTDMIVNLRKQFDRAMVGLCWSCSHRTILNLTCPTDMFQREHFQCDTGASLSVSLPLTEHKNPPLTLGGGALLSVVGEKVHLKVPVINKCD